MIYHVAGYVLKQKTKTQWIQQAAQTNKEIQQQRQEKKTHSIEKLATQIHSIYLIMVPIIGNELQSKQWYLLYKELQQE